VCVCVCVCTLPVFKVELLLSNSQGSSDLMKDALGHRQRWQLDDTIETFIKDLICTPAPKKT